MNDKHEQHVREVAEEMAKEYYTSIGEEYPVWDEKVTEIISQHDYAARIAVRREADAFVDGYTCLHKNKKEFKRLFADQIRDALLARGLIASMESASSCPHCSAKLDKQNVCRACGFDPY